ncbi:MAG: Rieske 2Fe-2S domain-containing protein [Chloroflexota bacterium]|nr:Rieske 2Fe-2S domain-containing protein [Chloroflexota bacterium]MDE2885674.1 Rieske 2Fe-2S domain-containing protein [Chloroflexota bacterium]
MVSLGELREVVNWQEGLISPSVLFDKELYREEQTKVFEKVWMVVGHEDMLRKPGDYVTNYMGEVPVVVSRDMEGELHVLVNRCVHRGNEVCLFDRGNARAFTCSYHGWTYEISGKLIGVPMEKELYRDEIDHDSWGLEQVRVASYKGLIFATFDQSAPSLEEWLGEDGCWWLRNYVLVEHLGGLEALPGWHRYRTPGNWKHLAENFIGDDYHVIAATHVSWLKVVQEFTQKGYPIRRAAASIAAKRYEVTTGYLKGCPMGFGNMVLGQQAYEQDLALAEKIGHDAVEWVRYRNSRFQEVMKEYEIAPYSFQNGAIFPNLGLMGFLSPLAGRQFLLFHPRGTAEMEQWQWTMVEKEAPAIVKEVAAEYAYRGQHMAGTIAPDDVENQERIVEAMRAPRNWRKPHNYRLQLGHEEEAPQGIPGQVGPNPSEINQRNFYRFWLELMEA